MDYKVRKKMGINGIKKLLTSLPMGCGVVYNENARQEFSWDEITVLYSVYSRNKGWLPIRPKLETREEKIAMLSFIMSCESKFVDPEKLQKKLEEYSKWNELMTMLEIYTSLHSSTK